MSDCELLVLFAVVAVSFSAILSETSSLVLVEYVKVFRVSFAVLIARLDSVPVLSLRLVLVLVMSLRLVSFEAPSLKLVEVVVLVLVDSFEVEPSI